MDSSSSSGMGRFRFLRALMALYVNFQSMIQNGSDNDRTNESHISDIAGLPDHRIFSDDYGSTSRSLFDPTIRWYHQRLQPYLQLCFAFDSVLYAGESEHQRIAIINSQPFGKVLILDEKPQSAEKDEFVYHECLVHPALLIHEEPRTVFIMGGGVGSTAREVLKHRNIQRVIMCDIDEEVVKQSLEHMDANRDISNDGRLEIAFRDAKEFLLENVEEKFDVIVGDLGCYPIETLGGPCMNPYSKSFHELVVKPKLNPNGIYVTQAGLAGVLSHKDLFSPFYNTLKQVFNHVVAYTAHVPSCADTCGWVLASDDEAICRLDGEELNKRIWERISGELRYLDGPCIVASTVLNKTLQTSLMNETSVIADFI